MPNFSGLWTPRQQLQAITYWPRNPGAPTSISATDGDGNSVVSFTAPDDTGFPAGITGYRVTATPGNITASGSSSPITITGLTNNVTYSITVAATNVSGYGAESSAVSVTPTPIQQIAYTTGGTYTFIVPEGLTPNSISVVCVGGGSGSGYATGGGQAAGGGGGLRYRNNITGLTAGQSINVSVAGPIYWSNNDLSSFGTSGSDSFYVYGGGGSRGAGGGGTGTAIGGDVGGGNGGSQNGNAGGGAGGYSGNGGTGGASGSGGGGGGGAGVGTSTPGGGGGVGLLGEGTSGSAGGGGGSGGTNGGAGGASGYTANGGSYGGGAGGDYAQTDSYGVGQGGAVRVIYSHYNVTRSFPSTNTGDL